MKILFLIVLGIFYSCSTGQTNLPPNEINEETHCEMYFEDVRQILKEDNGKFWGLNLYGPMILVNPIDRVFYANQNNGRGEFDITGGIYRDTLPAEINMANTAIQWNGEKWTMLMLPLPDVRHARNQLVIHELFHRVQPELGFDNLLDENTSHLETKEARIFLKLELEASKKALTDTKNRMDHLKNAMAFRLSRYKDPAIKEVENSLEINEGLAEYTAVMLSGRNDSKIVQHLTKSINEFYEEPSYLRSFAYETVPVYGYLLSLVNNNWHLEITRNTNLTDFFIRSFHITFPDVIASLVSKNRNLYHYDRISYEEEKREKEHQTKITEYHHKFLSKSTLHIPFVNMQMSFDYRITTSLGDLGTVYPQIRITDQWGILTVENGALIPADWSKVIITAPKGQSGNILSGDGWKLEIRKDWQATLEDGIYRLIKKNS